MQTVMIGDTVVLQINRKLSRPAKVLQVNKDGSADLMILVHPDDYPQFTKVQCTTGNAPKKGVRQGTVPGTFYYPATPASAAPEPRE